MPDDAWEMKARGRSDGFHSSCVISHCAFTGGIMHRSVSILLACVFALSLSGCGYNALQQQDEQIKAAWSEVVNQYQRRADLIPNLVNTVKGYAQQEKDVLIGVTEARA